VRILVLIVQEKSLMILGYEIHHMYPGIILVLISGFSRFFSKNWKINNFDLTIFAIGTGLIIDEAIFLIFTRGNHSDYFSLISNLGAIVLAATFAIIFYGIYKYEIKPRR
jgi:hypothetical protein